MQPWTALPVFSDRTRRGAVLAVIRSYQLVIAPLLLGSCRYEPSCSRYAEEAVLTHGPLRGSWLALTRVLRCHPFGGFGFDPVPASEPRHCSARPERWSRGANSLHQGYGAASPSSPDSTHSHPHA